MKLKIDKFIYRECTVFSRCILSMNFLKTTCKWCESDVRHAGGGAGHMQTLHHCAKGTGASIGAGVYRGSGTHAPQTPQMALCSLHRHVHLSLHAEG